MFCENLRGVIGWATDPETGEQFEVNIANGEGLERYDGIQAAQLAEGIASLNTPIENPDGTIDLGSTRETRVLASQLKRMRDKVCNTRSE